MSLGNDPSINSALRRLERLSSLDEQQLTELAKNNRILFLLVQRDDRALMLQVR